MYSIWFACFWFALLYFILIYKYAFVWKKTPEFKSEKPDRKTQLSVIVSARNEENTIDMLLKCLVSQNYDNRFYEIIIVNDHSQDKTADIVKSYQKKNKNLHLIEQKPGFSGKKAAIAAGIKVSNGELVVTTDADCTMNTKWLTTIAAFYSSTKADMIIAPVFIRSDKKWFSQYQSLEYASLMASAAGAALKGSAIMCSAANMAFRSVLFDNNNILNDKYVSGDDMFLLQHLKNNDRKIAFLKSKEVVVFTNAKSSIKSFMKQRQRWTSKSSGYTDFNIIGVAVLVLVFNLFISILFVLSWFSTTNILLWIALLLIKSVADILLLKPFLRFFNQQQLLTHFLGVQLLYPFYIVVVVVYSLFPANYWERNGS